MFYTHETMGVHMGACTDVLTEGYMDVVRNALPQWIDAFEI